MSIYRAAFFTGLFVNDWSKKVQKNIAINYLLSIAAYHDTTTAVARLLNVSDVYSFYIC